MEHLTYRRMSNMVTFGVPNNKELDKFATKPTQKRFEELVTKVEKHSKLAENLNSTIKIIYGLVGVTLLLLIGVAVATYSSHQEPSIAEQRQKEYLELANKLLENSSQNNLDTFLNVSAKTLTDPSLLKPTATNSAKDSTPDDDEYWIILIGKTVNSLDRKVMLPKLFFFVTCILGIGVMILTAKSKLDKRKSYQRVCDLLNRENQEYFCKQGYIWSIDHNLTQLVVTRSHESRDTQEHQSRGEVPSSDGEQHHFKGSPGMKGFYREHPGVNTVKPNEGTSNTDISGDDAMVFKTGKMYRDEPGIKGPGQQGPPDPESNIGFGGYIPPGKVYPRNPQQQPMHPQEQTEARMMGPQMLVHPHMAGLHPGAGHPHQPPQHFVGHQARPVAKLSAKVGPAGSEAPGSGTTHEPEDTIPNPLGSLGGPDSGKTFSGGGVSVPNSHKCSCRGLRPCRCGQYPMQLVQKPAEFAEGPAQEELSTGEQEQQGMSQYAQQHAYMMHMREMYPGYFQNYHPGFQDPRFFQHPYYYQHGMPPMGAEQMGHYHHYQQEGMRQQGSPEEMDPGLDSGDDPDNDGEQGEEPEDSSASEAGVQSLSRSFGRTRKFRPGTSSVHGNFATKLL